MRNIALLVFVMFQFVALGQEYNYKATIPKVEKTGYYKILLSPEITSFLNADYSDIRIYNAENEETPYILEKENSINKKRFFVDYEIIEKQYFKKNRYTRIVFHNKYEKKINNIVLKIKNAEVGKRLILNASYDKKNWYAVKDFYYNSITNNDVAEGLVLQFPSSDYEYYELIVDDFFDKPINIFQVGFYNSTQEKGEFSEIGISKYLIKDSLNETHIAIPVSNFVDRISFEVNSPENYNRKAEFYVNQKILKKNKKQILKNVNLVSDTENTFSIIHQIEDTLHVRIENNDNQSLNISDIKLHQLNKYLTAKLDAGREYELRFSNKEITKPEYDLVHFSNIIPKETEILKISKIEKNTRKETELDNINFDSFWLWSIIIAIGSLLTYMSYSMVNGKSKE